MSDKEKEWSGQLDVSKVKCTSGGCKCVPVQIDTPEGPLNVIVPKSQSTSPAHIQQKFDEAIKIEMDGTGKIVNVEDPLAARVEETDRRMAAMTTHKPKGFFVRLWERVVGFFSRKTKGRKTPDPAKVQRHVIKRA
jgi:hypothetical protein